MRKRCNRVKRPACAPTLVALHNTPESGIIERTSLDSLSGGWATPTHFNCLLDCADMLVLVATDRKDEGVAEIGHFARDTLFSIGQRYRAKGKLGATGEELKVLRVLLDVSDDFWKRQAGSVFVDAYVALDKFRTYQQALAKETA